MMGVDGEDRGRWVAGYASFGSEEGEPCIIVRWAVRFHHTRENFQGCYRRWDAVVRYELINGGWCMCQRIVKEEEHTVEYYQDSVPCEKIVLSPEDFAAITDHLESVEPVDNPNLQKLFARYST